MPQIVKSVLFFDYDSIYRSLQDRYPAIGDNFAARATAWLTGVETGELISPRGEGVRRRILIKRCYADPKILGANRSVLIACGIQIVDCPTQSGQVRNAADISIVLDTIDALEHATGFEEFILLSAASDLSPVLFRLRAHNRASVVYADATTTPAYLAFSDAAIEEPMLAEILKPDGGLAVARRQKAEPEIGERQLSSQGSARKAKSIFPETDGLASPETSRPRKDESSQPSILMGKDVQPKEKTPAFGKSGRARPQNQKDQADSLAIGSVLASRETGRVEAHSAPQSFILVPAETPPAKTDIAATVVNQANAIEDFEAAEFVGAQPESQIVEEDDVGNAEPPRMAERETQREELAALVRRMHQATRVPLFSPRSFADLFRILSSEVAKNGYRFQATAENITNEMIALGRNVTRRQVGFVVKGLALKGHSFTGRDTPEELAMLFREQVLYLARNANLNLSDHETDLITAWIVGRSTTQPTQPPPPPQARIEATPNPQPRLPPEARPAIEAVLQRPPNPAEEAPAKRPPPRGPRAKLAEVPPPPRIDLPVEKREPLIMSPPEPLPKLEPITPRRGALRPLRRAPAPKPEPAEPAPAERRLTTASPQPDRRMANGDASKQREEDAKTAAEDMESSILAAIAEAVEVNVPTPSADEFHFDLDSPPAEGDVSEDAGEDTGGNDIGDEIQRILATYGQNRRDRG